MIDDLGENSLAKIHPSLSEICFGTLGGRPKGSFRRKTIQIEKSSTMA
jgi:hypothetical protein